MNPWTVTGGENVPRPKRNRKPGARPARRSFVPSESSISEEASESSSTLEAPEDIEHVANVYRITEDIEAGGGAGGEQVRLEEEFQDAPETPPRSNPSRNGSPKETTPALLPHAQNRWLCFHDENLERRYLAAFATADGYESFLIVSIIGCIGYAVIILSFLPSRTIGACAPHGGCPGTFWWPRALQTLFYGLAAVAAGLVIKLPTLKKKVVPYSQAFFVASALMQILGEVGKAVYQEMYAPWWARCEYDERYCPNAHVAHMMVRWLVTFFCFSYVRLTFQSMFVVTVLVLVSSVPLLVPWGTGYDAEDHQWQINRQDTFAPLFALVSLLIPAMLLIRTYAMERQHRMHFIHMQLLHSNIDVHDVRSAVPRSMSRRLVETDAKELITEEFDTLTVLNCRLSQSDIQRIATQEGELACTQTLRRLVDEFDQLVLKHGCHKVEHSNNAYRVVPLQVFSGRMMSSGDEDNLAEEAALLIALAEEIRQTCTEVASPAGLRIRPSIGIASSCGVGAVIGTARRSYRVYGEAVNTAIAISTTAGSGRVIIDGSTHKLIPPYLCITKRINMREVKLNRSDKPLEAGVESARMCFELTRGEFQRRVLRSAKRAIMSDRSGMVEPETGSREKSSQHVPEEMYLHVDTSLYTWLGVHKDEAVEKMYLADASLQNLSTERTQQTVIRLGVHVALFAPMLFTSLERHDDRGYTAVQGEMPDPQYHDDTSTNVFIALSALAVLVADALILVYRKELETLSAHMRLAHSSVWFQLPSVLLVYLSVGCEVLNARRIALTMFMVGVLEVQSPWVLSTRLPDTADSMREQVLMIYLPTIAMFFAVCLPKPPAMGKYPYLALGCIIVLGLLNLRLTRIHHRVMWWLEKELCARHDQALRQMSALVPSEAACDHLINQSVIERLGVSDCVPHHVWLEPNVKEGALLSMLMMMPEALDSATELTILHETMILIDAALSACQRRNDVVPVVLETPGSEEESSPTPGVPSISSTSMAAYIKRRRLETLTTLAELPIELQPQLSASELRSALPLIRLDHAAPRTFLVATSSAGDAGVRLLLALGGAVSAAVRRYADEGPHGLPSGSVYVQMGLGTGSMWSGLFPPVRRYHCFGDAYMKSEVLAARSRPYRIRMEREVAHKYRDTSIVYCGGGSRDGCSETVPPRRDSSTGPSHEINELSLVAAPDTLLRQPSPIET